MNIDNLTKITDTALEIDDVTEMSELTVEELDAVGGGGHQLNGPGNQ
jgi:hypothetical protein